MHNGRIHHCLYCWSKLDQRASGRPRRICGAPSCRRAADAERRRIQRRRAAGLQSVTRRIAEPLPGGGRDPLLRRLAKLLALEVWPSVVATREEIDGLMLAIQAGLESAWMIRDALHKEPASSLPDLAWSSLRSLSQRAVAGQVNEEEAQALAVLSEAGLVADPITGAWVRRR